MGFYADLHIHSKYSRATSRDCDFEHLTLWAKRKGITVVATGDFTHPAWWQEIQDKLKPAEPGLFRLRPELERAVDAQLPPSCRRPVRFLLEVEISTIYKKGDKTRKVHHLIYAAHLETAGRFRDALGAIGNIKSDGRPILGLDSRHLLEITLESGDDAYLIPAHIWTPWFSAMGSKSGFDSVDDCYGDLAEHIFAVETGLSSDPPMNWRVSHLDRFTLVSSSDAHSPPMLGREANLFETELDYFAMRRALETGEGWGGTVEFFPDEGKYHLDGHRKCGVCLDPAETRRRGGRCPTCGKPVTVGVLHRVEELADRELDYLPENPAEFRSLVPLPEVVSEIRGVGPKSKTVAGIVMALTAKLGPELEILQSLPVEDVERHGDPLMAEAIRRLRRGEVRAEGGYDGQFGTIRVFQPDEIVPQLTLAPLFGEDFAAAPAPATAPAEGFDPEPTATITTPTAAPTIDKADLPILDRLDPDQRRAACHLQGPLLIVAGPGSGKTRALTHRLAHLVESGVDPASCLAITFTRRAAGEMRERLEGLLGQLAGRLKVTTFHGLGLELLRRYAREAGLPDGFRIADETTRRKLVAERFGLSPKEAGVTVNALVESRGRRLAEEASESDEVDSDSTVETEREPAGEISIQAYRQVLSAEGLVDLDELLARPVELLDAFPELAERERARFQHLCVDEYQDVDPVQYRLLRHLAPADGNLCAIGDPDQSIYRFRGADVGFFLRFQQDFPTAEVIELERNYRSQPTIVRAAEAVIRPTSLVPGRKFQPMVQDPSPVILHEAASERAEAEFVVHTLEELLGGTSYFSFDSGRVDELSECLHQDISFNDIAVLTRTRAQAGPLLEAFERAAMPVQSRTHQRLANHPEVRTLIHELHARLEKGEAWVPEDLHRLASLLATDPEGDPEAEQPKGKSTGNKSTGRKSTGNKSTGRKSTGREPSRGGALDLLKPLIERHPQDLEGFLAELATGAELDTWDPRAERISVLTLHASKGLEFPVVFMVGCDDGLLPMTWNRPDRAADPEEINEERRLFFVGATRARRLLILTRAKKRFWRGEARSTEPSPFLKTLGPHLLERRFYAGPKRKPTEPTSKQLSLL